MRALTRVRIITEMAAHREPPPMTPGDILDRLDALGLHDMVVTRYGKEATTIMDDSCGGSGRFRREGVA